MKNAIGPNERVLWAGRPKQGLDIKDLRDSRNRDPLYIGVFCLLWGAGVASVRGKNASPFTLFAGPVVMAIGAWLFLGRYVMARRRRARTIYAITERRILIVQHDGSAGRIDFVLPSEWKWTVQAFANGEGTITFAPATKPSDGKVSRAPEFARIENVQEVAELLKEVPRLPSSSRSAVKEPI